MFVTVEGRTLRQALKPIIAIIERRNTIPILNHVLLSHSVDGLHITSTDLDIEATATVDVIDGTGEWKTCIPANVLASIAAAAGPMIVRIEPTENAVKITLDDEAASYEVPTLPANDFPAMGGNRRHRNLIETFTNGMLASTLAKVAWCISTEETRYYLNGVSWQSTPDGCRFIATDGHRLAICRYSPAEDEPSSRIIPRKTVRIIMQHMARHDVKVFATDKEHILDFVAPHVTIRSKMIDGTFPNVDRVIPRAEQIEHEFIFKREEIISAVNQVEAIDRQKGRAIRFFHEEGRISIERRNPDFGSATAKTSAAWPEELSDDFGFNSRYVQDFARSCQGDMKFQMIDRSAPFMITDEDESMTRVLMPMRG